MGKKTWKSGISLFLAAALAVTSFGMASPLTADAAKNRARTLSDAGIALVSDNDAVTGDNGTYYIDALNGNDSNDGKSEGKAWKSLYKASSLQLGAGGKVLLKAGCTWSDEKLMVKNAKGTKENPVIVGKYGEGKNPIINGNGSKWLDSQNRSALKKEDVAAVHIQNSQFITIENLEVTNWESDKADLEGKLGKTNSNSNSPGRKILFDQSKYMLTGILVENHDAGELAGVTIRNNYVHDVNGYMSTNGSEGHKKGSGGIMVLVTGGETESYFKDLQIEGNEVNKVCHEAIYMESCWAARTLVGGAGSQQAGNKPWVGWPNVHVKNNYVHDVAGDGIVLINADGGLAENNLVVKAASEDWYYSRNPAHAAIWAWDCNNVTFQNNEAAYTESTQDGMAFDSDYGNQNILFQYNYSHNNKGGFWMACPGPYYSINSVVRYNVSVNDGRYDGSRILWVGESGSIGHQVYNNTMYWDDSYDNIQAVKQGAWISGNATAKTSGTDIYNNIFYGDSQEFVNHEGVHYSNNCVWGGAEKAYPWEEDQTGMAADPGLKDLTAAGHTDGAFANGTVTLGSTAGMELAASSPCIDAGKEYMAVPNESFDAVENEKLPNDKTQITLENKDYKGNSVPYKAGTQAAATEKVDLGAFEFQGASTGDYAAPEEDKAWLQELLELAKGVDKTKYEDSSVQDLEGAIADANTALQSKSVQVSAMVYRMEHVLMNMLKKGEGGAGSAADNMLTEAQSGFESGTSGWGHWPDAVSVTASKEQKRTGSQSLKIAHTGKETAYSELGGISVQPNTDYIFEAWLYCSTSDASKVELQAKHHNSVTSDKKDHPLGSVNLENAQADPEHSGWYKAKLAITTEDYNKVSLVVSSNLETVYMDDAVLYPAQKTVTKLNRTNIEKALAMEPEYAQTDYPTALWTAYQEAYAAARLARVNPVSEQKDIDTAASALNTAYRNLAKKAEKTGLLRAYYTVQAAKQKGNYTDVSWNRFQTALQNAKQVLDQGDQATQAAADKALADLKTAVNKLEEKAPIVNPPAAKKNQTISVKSAITKAYGDKAFSLGAKITAGNGKLSYKSSDNKVAQPNSSGKITIKGIGKCTITVTASGTATYNAKTTKVTLTVNPKKAKLKALKPGKKSLKVTWTKDAKATGYEVQCCLKKNFKSGVKKATIKKAKTTSTTMKKLKKGKKYYVRIRAYKTVKIGGKSTKLTGAWSKVMTSKKVK